MMWIVATYLPSKNATGLEERVLRLGSNGTTSIKFSCASFCAIFFSSSLSGLSLSPHHCRLMGFSALGEVFLKPAPCTEIVLRLQRRGKCVVSALFGFSREHQRSFISLTALRCTRRRRCGGSQTSRTRWPALHSWRQPWMVLRPRRGRSERRVNESTVTTPLLRSGRRSQAKFTTILTFLFFAGTVVAGGAKFSFKSCGWQDKCNKGRESQTSQSRDRVLIGDSVAKLTSILVVTIL